MKPPPPKVNCEILLPISQLFTQNLALPLYQYYPNPFLIKQQQKSDDLSPKSFFSFFTKRKIKVIGKIKKVVECAKTFAT